MTQVNEINFLSISATHEPFTFLNNTATIERNRLSLVRRLMRKNKLGVSWCDKELRRDFNAFPVAITKEGEKYRSKGKSLSLTSVPVVFLFKNFFLEKFGEGTSLNIVLLVSDNLSTRDRFQKYRIKKFNRSEQLLLHHKRNEGTTRDFGAISWKPLRNKAHFPEVGFSTGRCFSSRIFPLEFLEQE